MPDVPHVRLAMPAEAATIAWLQRDAWADDPVLAVGLDTIALDDAVEVWQRVIVRPPLAHYRVFVALDGDRPVGFALVGPSDDPDADATDSLVHEFVIVPAARRQGHGSRLMQACVDAMCLDGYERATWWASSTDDVLRAFLIDAGWASDGAHRELATADEAHSIKQVRLHTDIRKCP